MQALRRVIPAADFSRGSEDAIERAVLLAKTHGARLDDLARRLPGSTALDVLHHTACDVLVVP
jgi:nucleotide-binding universal stress UspA family protein